ncbi:MULTISPECIES: ABC transporter ATP-binding protein [unclassified Cytobacillus]|uniref:ABC transporter ATP-binding protein n=1 Tax=unclassified Cytobacillus TaxID=2675268 RepID=UPI00135CC6CC|nr:ABC transporter ATP-binding protein [Cytobacillus sp. AMY 15.2]KAF0816529.1 Hydroxymethylpyrimidine ABC transporter, ATPase component [Bacillus sp. ZZV12-4809]MCM3090255.1 ABC transporter ATP-binding protein [Cytobacillus sp. AMY 15.2]
MIQLSVNSISKSFDSNQVLNNLSFQVNEGEFVSILGPSGSGKSTIFNLIGGMLLPDEGSIKLGNTEISGKRGSISYMPQTPSLMPWRTILQNVMLGQEIMGKADPETARNMLQKAGLGDYENAYPHELSGGMKQRAAFIRALLSPQPIILLDEPFSALDELTRHDMQKWLLDIWNEHKPTILFVTHNIEEALYLSDRILVLSSKPAKVMNEYVVPFNRPRVEELLLNEEFLACKRSIHHALKNH